MDVDEQVVANGVRHHAPLLHPLEPEVRPLRVAAAGASAYQHVVADDISLDALPRHPHEPLLCCLHVPALGQGVHDGAVAVHGGCGATRDHPVDPGPGALAVAGPGAGVDRGVVADDVGLHALGLHGLEPALGPAHAARLRTGVHHGAIADYVRLCLRFSHVVQPLLRAVGIAGPRAGVDHGVVAHGVRLHAQAGGGERHVQQGLGADLRTRAFGCIPDEGRGKRVDLRQVHQLCPVHGTDNACKILPLKLLHPLLSLNRDSRGKEVDRKVSRGVVDPAHGPTEVRNGLRWVRIQLRHGLGCRGNEEGIDTLLPRQLHGCQCPSNVG
mmetsp:Transcript_117446/g.284931  ORF Transcript_117446/g.284931 Transcript_117446/m.284931 type:complete len:327 (-) Transcript_117446:328-1308(-)